MQVAKAPCCGKSCCCLVLLLKNSLCSSRWGVWVCVLVKRKRKTWVVLYSSPLHPRDLKGPFLQASLSQQESVMWSFAHFQTPGALMWFCICSPSPHITVMSLAQWGNLFGWWWETGTNKTATSPHARIWGFFFLNVWIKTCSFC